MSSIKPGPIHCPSCNHAVARHRWFVGKRVRELSCTHCGAQLEVTIPAWPHYATALALALIGEFFVVAMVMLPFFRMWWALPLAFALFAAIELLRSMWLRDKSQVHWINRESTQRQAAGAWVPK